MEDVNGKKLTDGSIIDIKQTVNGQNLFVVVDVEELDIRYRNDLEREYEYDKKGLLAPDKFTGELDWEIIGNIFPQHEQ